MSRLNAANNARTILTQNITNTATSFAISDASAFPSPPFRISIDDEIMEVTGVNANTLTVTRAVENTTASSHNNGTIVENRPTAGSITELVSSLEVLSPNQTQSPSSPGNGTLLQILSWLTNRIKSITGKTNWWDAPDTTLTNAKTHIDAAAPHSGHALSVHTHTRAQITDFNHVSNHATGGTDALSPADIGAATTVVYTTTLDTTWNGSAAPYTKTQTVTGILATDTPIIDVVMSGTYATDEARIEAWGYIYRVTTAANSITLYATDKPTVSLPIQIKVVR
jgi:hypothetical protein